ncbi:unnamed protein product [Rhizophagus irregularis]|nr:unnamed protein product [Rhizophagus irregularis]
MSYFKNTKNNIQKVISSGLVDLVSVQQNLKYMCMYRFGLHKDLKDTINLISKIPNTLISINIYGGRMHPNISLSFISRFTKLQELILTFYSNEPYRDFSNLQYDIFPYLQRLEFKRECPDNDSLVNFLEINGKNLKEFIKLSTKFSNDELDTLKLILNTCQYLETIDIFCKEYMNDLNLIEML